jgi:4-hydroxy-3-methylbut-2-en-1-yl diphosphate synthase IspG/GcpE
MKLALTDESLLPALLSFLRKEVCVAYKLQTTAPTLLTGDEHGRCPVCGRSHVDS